MANASKLYLIDGSGYIFRAFYAIRPLSTRSGLPTNAVVGFARMLMKLLREAAPHYLGIAFDTKEKNFRHKLYGEYKANRDAPPEDLIPQFALIHELVNALDIPVLLSPGFEADDVLATMAKKGVDSNIEVVIVSADKDLMQLVRPGVALYDPMKDKHFDREAVIERFGVPPERVVDVQALAGDSSDNIPGVPKVGPKGAAKLVSEYGDIEQIIEALSKLDNKKAVEQSVVDNAHLARLSKQLASLADNVPMPLDLQALTYTLPQVEKIMPFLQKIEATSLLRDFGLAEAAEAMAEARAAVIHDTHTPVAGDVVDRSVYRTIFNEAELAEVLSAARRAGRLSVDLETTSLDATRAQIVGIALCVPGSSAVYVPVGHHYLGVPKQISTQSAIAALKPVLEDATVLKVGQNIKYDLEVFANYDVALTGIGDDSMLAAYILNPSRLSYSLDALSKELLGHENIQYKDVTGSGKNQHGFEEVPVDKATQYAAEDADVALRLCDLLATDVRSQNLDKLYRELELPLIPVLASMERAGILIDVPHLHAMAKEFGERLQALEQQAYALIGGPINLASPKQLGTLLFETMALPVVKKTKTGYSTDQEVLETLARDHALPRVILEHRMLAKLKSTYIDALPKMLNPTTKRLHTSYNQTGTATGRLSSTDPNLQNIPIRGEDGRRIRSTFVAPPGWWLISADYSQIELRVMAHLSGDEHFIEAFKQGEDIHRRTAMEILTGGQEPDGEMRRRAKAINFGILYGLSEFGLAKQLDISRHEASRYIAAYFGRYPKIRQFLDATIEQARKDGYVTTLWGRRRFLPDINSQNKNIRQGAERIAMNTPIQGSAADLLKAAMLRVHARLKNEKFQARMLLQVHDELVIEAPDAERDTARELLRYEMSNVIKLAVPLVVETGCAVNWADAH